MSVDAETPWLLAYDLERRVVGCAIVQAGLGGNVPNEILDQIGPWAAAPTPEMRVYALRQVDLDELVAYCRANNLRP